MTETDYGLVLFRADGSPAFAEEGPFGVAAPAVGVVVNLVRYELMTPAGSVPGRPDAGTSLSDEVRTSDNGFEVTAAATFAGLAVVAALASLPPEELPAALLPVNVIPLDYSLDEDGRSALGFGVSMAGGGRYRALPTTFDAGPEEGT